MLRKDMRQRIACDQRGKIKTGMKAKNNQGKEYPKSLDYFNVDAFPELINVYGLKPDRLIVVFPSNAIDDFFQTEYNAWGGVETPIKKRVCDGEQCTHKTTETLGGVMYAAGSVTECICKKFELSDKERCSAYMGMKAFIVHPDGKIHNPICYLFESHSTNTADNLYSQILNTQHLTGGKLIGIPFVLTVKMIDTVEAGQKRKYPIWNIQAFGQIEHILHASDQGILPTREGLSLLDGTNDNKQLQAPDPNQQPDYTEHDNRTLIITDLIKEANPGKTTFELKAAFEKATGRLSKSGCRALPIEKLDEIIGGLKHEIEAKTESKAETEAKLNTESLCITPDEAKELKKLAFKASRDIGEYLKNFGHDGEAESLPKDKSTAFKAFLIS
jgi:hypothetical protein